MPQLRTFELDLNQPTHVQLKFPLVDVYDMLHLSFMQIFISIGNHLHIGINKKHVKDMLPQYQGGNKYKVMVCGSSSL